MNSKDFSVAIFKGNVIHKHLLAAPEKAIELVTQAYLTHHSKQAINPDSYFLRFSHKPEARIIALPAWLGGDFQVAGLKWIGSFPGNVKDGFPRASAVLILNDDQTGYPIAILESSIISAVRTAASAVLGAQLLRGSRHARTLGIMGCGLIARYVVEILNRTGWKFDEVITFDTTEGEGQRFIDSVCRPAGLERCRTVASSEALVRESDLTVLTTTAPTPHLTDPRWFAHNPTVLHLSLRDLSPEIILGAFNITDDVDHVMKAATSPHLAEQKVGHRRFMAGTVAALHLQEIKVDRSRPQVFSPFGMGILDLALGKWLYDHARAEAVVMNDFFFDLTR